jgi:hypothetical protein
MTLHSFSPFTRVALLGAAIFVGGCSTASAENDLEGGLVDWSAGNQQQIDTNCGPFIFHNSKDGGIYGLIVKGRLPRTCKFEEKGVIFHMPANFGPTVAGKQTLFSFARVGNDVYVAWIRPYD